MLFVYVQGEPELTKYHKLLKNREYEKINYEQ